jgi:hypothetical protein
MASEPEPEFTVFLNIDEVEAFRVAVSPEILAKIALVGSRLIDPGVAIVARKDQFTTQRRDNHAGG